MSTRVIVQLEADVVPHVRDGRGVTPAAADVLATAADLGIRLEPLHPGVEDRALRSYFAAQVQGARRVEDVCDALLTCEAVQAAYPEASAEPPLSKEG